MEPYISIHRMKRDGTVAEYQKIHDFVEIRIFDNVGSRMVIDKDFKIRDESNHQVGNKED